MSSSDGGSINDGGTGAKVWVHWWTEGDSSSPNIVYAGRHSGKFSINLVFPPPNTMYSIRFRNESFMIAPDEVKDLIKILSQRDIVTKNPKGMDPIK